MKILLLTALVALAAGDVSHLLNQPELPTYQYQQPSFQNVPQSSYGAPQASVLGNIDGSGSVQSVSYSGSGAVGVPQLTLPSASGPTLTFNSGFSSPAVSGGSISGATIQTYDNGGFSTPVPLTQDAFASFQASTAAPSVDLSSLQQTQTSIGPVPSVNYVKYQEPSQSNSYQFLSKLSQPTVSSIGFNSARFGADAAINSGSFGSDSQLNAGLGFGGATSGFSAVSSADSQFNSGLGLGGSQFISKSSELGGSINDAFGVSTDAAASFGVSENAEGSLEPEVSKHLYFFDAPEDEEEEAETKINIPPVAPKKTYKIIFIKAPTYRSHGTISIPAPPPTEEKTLVYVLVKKPEKNTNVRFQTAAPTKPSKPEVFFIKYKTQKEAEAAVAEIQNKHGATGQVIANIPAGQTIDHIQIPTDIGASSSPVSFGGLKSGGFGGDSFDSIQAKSFGSSGTFGFSARSGIDDSQLKIDDSAPAQSGNEQASIQFGAVGTSVVNPVSFGQQSVSSFQGFGGAVSSSQSEASASVDNDKSKPNVESGASSQDSEDDESKDGPSSSQPEESEKNEDSQNGIKERVDDEPSQDTEGEGSNLAAFKTYDAPDPSLFKKYGPPEA